MTHQKRAKRMSDPHPIRNGIIASTVGGLLVYVVLWAVGVATPVLKGIASVASWLWHLVTVSTAVPISLLIVGVLYMIAVTVMAFRREIDGLADQSRELSGPQGRPLVRTLTRPQQKVMRALVTYDGSVVLDQIGNELETSPLRVEPVVEELVALGLVEFQRSVDEDSMVRLTRAGRDYALAKRWA